MKSYIVRTVFNSDVWVDIDKVKDYLPHPEGTDIRLIGGGVIRAVNRYHHEVGPLKSIQQLMVGR